MTIVGIVVFTGIFSVNFPLQFTLACFLGDTMKTIRLVALAILAFLLNASTSAEETIKILGKGIGETKTMALKDAYRDAIERAVGLYVDAEQMVENEELVKNQILTHSNAYIEKYAHRKQGTDDNGYIAVTILATVRKAALTSKIRDVMPAQTTNLAEESKNIHAQIVTKAKVKENGLALLKNELKDLSPVKAMLKVTCDSTHLIVESVPEDSSLVRLWYPIRVEVDQKRYYMEFVPRISRILEQIKTEPAKRLSLKNELSIAKAHESSISDDYGDVRKGKSGIMTRCEVMCDERDALQKSSSSYRLNSIGMALNEEYRGMCFLSTIFDGHSYILHGRGASEYYKFENNINEIYDFSKANRFVTRVFPIDGDFTDYPLKKMPEDNNFKVALVKSSKGNILSGSTYKIPYECACAILDWQHNYIVQGGDPGNHSIALHKTTYNLTLSDANGVELTGISFTLRNVDVCNLAATVFEPQHSWNRNKVTYSCAWIITPLIGGISKSYVKWVCIDIPSDDVANIANATISVEE